MGAQAPVTPRVFLALAAKTVACGLKKRMVIFRECATISISKFLTVVVYLYIMPLVYFEQGKIID